MDTTDKIGTGNRPTVKTLARLTGFSIATVSKALRDSPAVTAETKDRIRRAAVKIGYAANPRAASLRTGKTQQAAVLMPVAVAEGHEWAGVQYAEVLSGISRALEGSGYQMAVHPFRGEAEALATVERIVARGLADGIVFSGVLTADPRIAFLTERDFPFVALGLDRAQAGHAAVDIDSRWLAEAATARLIAGGHRRIALINPDPRYAYAQDRLAGYRKAFADAGMTAPDLVVSGDLTARFGHDSVLALAGTVPSPTAFVCVNEATTLGVLAGLRAAGRDIGPDCAVIGYDDLNVSAYFHPPLTTFFHPVEELGRTAGAFLIRRIGGERPESLVRVFRPRLIIRQPDRIGPAARNDTHPARRIQ